ncbi:MAG: GntR family transcriptional regulator [Propionibacteriaceae bacterium]|nr:GntR family transcriptional regulator [Propionibacteriaceae bacterium]
MTVHAVPTALPIALDRMSPVPLYHQLFEQFVAAMEQGALRPGDTLEREDLLADRLDIARPTLRRALSDLAALGLLVRSRGRGTVVTERAAAYPSRTAQEARPPAGAPGPARWHVLRLDPDHLDAEAAGALGLGSRGPLVYLEQLLVEKGRSVSLLRSWLPRVLVNPERQDLAVTPFARALREAGHSIASERRTFNRRPADVAERTALGLHVNDMVFTITGVSFDGQGSPVERTTRSALLEGDLLGAQLAAS